MMCFRNQRTILSLFCLTVLATGGALAQPFVHPGCLSTSNDLARMTAKVAASAQPWKGSWDILMSNTGGFLSATPEAVPIINVGGGLSENYIRLARDCARAYQCALRYHGSGNTAYADKAVQIMNAWATTHTNWAGDSNVQLRAGLYGYQFACAAELMRNYGGWNPTDFTAFQNYLLNQYYPINSDFLIRHNGTVDGHYWANWDLASMASILAIGVLCDDTNIFNEAINYFYSGIGNGAISNAVHHVHPAGLGQYQESGRDQGHSLMGPQLMGVFCEIAWNQGVDLYSHLGNRFLSSVEYISKYNLWHEVPYVVYVWRHQHPGSQQEDIQPIIASWGGRGAIRPGWDLVYNHHVNRLGQAAPYTQEYAAKARPEGGGFNYGSTSGGFDGLGFTTLTHSLDPIAVNAIPAPSLLTADVRSTSATLSWCGSARATSYSVKRGESSAGPFTTVASGLSSNDLSYVEVGLAHGTTNYYVVSAVVNGIETTNNAPLAVTPNRRLTGVIIGTDGSWNSAGATKETVFDGSVKNFYDAVNGSGDWAGLDLGVSNVITQVKYCPRAGFAGRMVGGQLQGCNVSNFTGGVTTLYTITSQPPEGTLTTQTISNPNAFRFVRYLGPNNGSCNVAEVEFHGYSTSVPAAPLELKAVAGNAQATLTWTPRADTASFNLKRATVSGGPYTTIATNVTTTTHLDLGLTNFTNHYYVVSAVNAAGQSANSEEEVATPLPAFLNRAGAGTATANSGASGTEGADKAFDGNTGTKWYTGVVAPPGWLRYDFGFGTNWAVTRYDISSANDVPQRDPMNWSFQGSGNGATWVTLDSRTNETFASRFLTQSYVITNTTAYRFYRLYVTNNFGGSGYGIQLSELGLFAYGSPPPAAPTGLAATGGGTQISLNWSASSGATGYRVKRSATSGGPYTFNLIGTPTATDFVDANVVSGTTYYYVVSAVSANGEGGNSAEVNASPVSLAPVTITFALNGDQLQLSWPADHTGWRLQVQTNSPATGLGTNWFTISGSAATNQLSVPISPAAGSVFYRLTYP